MSQETVNLFVGAGISLVSTLLVIFVTNFFQWKRDERERKWQLNDKHDEQIKHILLQRLEQLESYSREIATTLSHINLELNGQISVNDRDEANKYFIKINEELGSLLGRLEHYAAVSSYLGGEVNIRFYKLSDKLNSSYALVLDLWDKILKGENTDFSFEELFETSGVLDVYSELLKEIDRTKLQANVLPSKDNTDKK